MPRIFITQPFLHHCAGTIFDLSDEIGIAGWSEGDMINNELRNYSFAKSDKIHFEFTAYNLGFYIIHLKKNGSSIITSTS